MAVICGVKDADDDEEAERSAGRNILRSRAEPLSPGASEHPPTVTLQHPDLLFILILLHFPNVGSPPQQIVDRTSGGGFARPLARAISPWPGGGLAGRLGRSRGLALAATGESRVAALPSSSSSSCSSCPRERELRLHNRHV